MHNPININSLYTPTPFKLIDYNELNSPNSRINHNLLHRDLNCLSQKKEAKLESTWLHDISQNIAGLNDFTTKNK